MQKTRRPVRVIKDSEDKEQRDIEGQDGEKKKD